MRDPKRIDRMLALIGDIWRAGPDLRVMQLLLNAMPRIEHGHYYVEDDALEGALTSYYGDWLRRSTSNPEPAKEDR